MRTALAALAVATAISAAYAMDRGQFGDVPDDVRSWFQSVTGKNGIPCCSLADGHRTTWRAGEDGGYEVPIAGQWVPVPPEAVIRNSRNPTGESIVWYSQIGAILNGSNIYIRCFVPGEEV